MNIDEREHQHKITSIQGVITLTKRADNSWVLMLPSNEKVTGLNSPFSNSKSFPKKIQLSFEQDIAFRLAAWIRRAFADQFRTSGVQENKTEDNEEQAAKTV